MNSLLIIHYGAEMKKPLPVFDEKWKDAFIHVAIKMLEKYSGQDVQICIKPEALECFPDTDKPIFVWDNSKGHWAAMNPKKSNLALPDKKVIDPSRN